VHLLEQEPVSKLCEGLVCSPRCPSVRRRGSSRMGRRLFSALPSSTNQNTTNAAATQIRPNLIGSASIYLPESEPKGTGSQYLVPVNASNVPLGPVGPLFTKSAANRDAGIARGDRNPGTR
jgi:hypothetical protein